MESRRIKEMSVGRMNENKYVNQWSIRMLITGIAVDSDYTNHCIYVIML